jgi:hypothetical protein
MTATGGPGHRRGLGGLETDGPGPGTTGFETTRFAGRPGRENICRRAHSKLTEWRAAIAHLGNFI